MASWTIVSSRWVEGLSTGSRAGLGDHRDRQREQGQQADRRHDAGRIVEPGLDDLRQHRGAHRDRQRIDRHQDGRLHQRGDRHVPARTHAAERGARRPAPPAPARPCRSADTDTTTNRSSGTLVNVRVPTQRSHRADHQARDDQHRRPGHGHPAGPRRLQRLLGQQLAQVAPRLRAPRRRPGPPGARAPAASRPPAAATAPPWRPPGRRPAPLPRRSQRHQHAGRRPGRRTSSPGSGGCCRSGGDVRPDPTRSASRSDRPVGPFLHDVDEPLAEPHALDEVPGLARCG